MNTSEVVLRDRAEMLTRAFHNAVDGGFNNSDHVDRLRHYVEVCAETLNAVADAQEPKRPKVESLRDAAERLSGARSSLRRSDVTDLCDLVLGRVDRLEELIQHEFVMSARTQGSLRQERAEIARMREGAGEPSPVVGR